MWDTVTTSTPACFHAEGGSSPDSPDRVVDGAVGSPQVSWPQLLPSRAQHWVVHALQRGLSDDVGAVLGLLVAEKQRQHVKLGEPTLSQVRGATSMPPGS